MFEACGVDRLLTLEVHNDAAFDNAFRIPSQNLQGTELFAEYFAAQTMDVEVVAVSPDTGGIKRAEQFRHALQQRLGRPVTSAYMAKHRRDDIVTDSLLIGDVQGKTAVIIDDLISTGSTLLRAAQACHAAGAKQILAGAVHGLFTAGTELLDSPLLERIAIFDTVPPFRLAPELAAQRLQILDSSAAVAALLAEEYGLDR